MLELSTCVFKICDFLLGSTVSEEGPVFVDQIQIQSRSGEDSILLLIVVIIELGHCTLYDFMLEGSCT